MAKPSKLFVLTNVSNEEAVMVHDTNQFQDDSLLYLLPDSRKSQGYTADGEIAFVGMDVLRGNGQLVELKSLPNVGENIESLALLTTKSIEVVELKKPVESDALYVFLTRPLSGADSIVGYTSAALRPEAIQSMVTQANNLLREDHDHSETLELMVANQQNNRGMGS